MGPAFNGLGFRKIEAGPEPSVTTWLGLGLSYSLEVINTKIMCTCDTTYLWVSTENQLKKWEISFAAYHEHRHKPDG